MVTAEALLIVCSLTGGSSLFSNAVAPGREDLVMMGANLQGWRRGRPVPGDGGTRVSGGRLGAGGDYPGRCRLAAPGRRSGHPSATAIRASEHRCWWHRDPAPNPDHVVAVPPDRVTPAAFDEPVVLIHSTAGDVLLRAVHS